MYWEFNNKNDFLRRMRFIRSFRLFIRQFLTMFEARRVSSVSATYVSIGDFTKFGFSQKIPKHQSCWVSSDL